MATTNNPMGFTQEELDKMEASRKRYDQLGKDTVRILLFGGEMTDKQYEEIAQYAKFMKMRDNGDL